MHSLHTAYTFLLRIQLSTADSQQPPCTTRDWRDNSASRTFGSPCGRRNEVVEGLRRLLITSRASSWVVPPPKVVFFRDAPGAEHPERLYCSSAGWAIGSSQRGVFNRVRRRIRRDRLLRLRLGAWRTRSSRSTTPSQEGGQCGNSESA